MPLNVPDKLPAIEILLKENIFVMDESRASSQDIRPLKIAILNLMPIKITTEIDLVRLLSNSPLQVELDFISLSTHVSKNTSKEHMLAFYKDFNLIIHNKYDGLIITGAPVEQMPFEEVIYWKELTEILSWAKSNVTSSIFTGVHRQRYITTMAFQNIHWIKKCSGSSSIKRLTRPIQSSEDLMMFFMYHIAVILK